METVSQGRITQAQLLEKARAESRARRSANWFFWIAGLSMINSLLVLLRVDFGFMLGLATTQVIDARTGGVGGTAPTVAAVLDVIAIGLFIGSGFLARAHQQWAYVLGFVLYIVDGVLLAGLFGLAWQAGLTGADIRLFLVGAAIHGYAIYRLSQGVAENQKFRALRRLEQQRADVSLTPPAGPSGPTYIVPY